MDQPAPEWGGFATLIVALTAGVSERYAAEPESALNRCVRILTRGNLMNDLNECERCAAEVNVSETLCTDCTRSVPMFEQSTAFDTVLEMLIQAEEDTIYTTV